MKRIAVISPSEFPGKSGDSTNYTEIINQLSKEGFKVLLICPKTDKKNQVNNGISPDVEIQRIPIQPPRLRQLKDGIKTKDWIKIIFFLIAESIMVPWILNRKKIKYVFVRHHIFTIQLPLIVRLMSLEAVADGALVCDSLQGYVGQSLVNRVKNYEKKNLRFYKYFILHTFSRTKNFKKFGLPEESLLTIPVSINLEKIPKFSIDSIPRHTFGYFGILEKSRGVDLLLEAFELLLKKIPDAKLYLIGEGSLKETLKEMVKTKNISSNVIFASVSRNELWNEYFKKFQITVDPNLEIEKDPNDINMSIKLIESLASGKPIIRIGMNSKNEQLKKGIMNVESIESETLAKSMIILATDKQKLEQFSKDALEYSKNYDIRNKIKEIIKAIMD